MPKSSTTGVKAFVFEFVSKKSGGVEALVVVMLLDVLD
jgi:hypothetical protein